MSATPELSVREAMTADPELVAAIRGLLPQLSSTAPAPLPRDLDEIVGSPSTMLLVARLDGRIVGSLTLATFRVPSGVRAWIEDVVVDAGARGAGVGEALVRAALEGAAARGARTVDLTSRASREPANRLYQRMGFETRQTNVYRLTLGTPPAGGAPAPTPGPPP